MLGVRGPGRGVLQPARGECRLPGTQTNVLQNHIYLQRPAKSSGEASSPQQAHV